MVISGKGGSSIIASRTPELENMAEDMLAGGQGVENIFDHIDEVHQILYGAGEGDYRESHRQIKTSADSKKVFMVSLYKSRSQIIHRYKDDVEKINALAAQAVRT